MSDVKWIKIVTNIFDDEKVKFIETMPNGDEIIVIWFKLLCLAGKSNSSGFLMITDKIAYTEEMLSSIFNRDIKVIQLALATFEKLEMVELVDNQIYIMNWEKHQSLDKLEAKKLYDREYQRKKREEKKKLLENKSYDNRATLAEGNNDNRTLDIDKEEDKEKDKEKEYIYVQSDTITHEPPIITITLNDKSEYPIYQKMIDDYKELYPAVDIIQELKKMKGWCNSNPTKRKTKRGILRFINSWLARKQDESSTYKPMINVNEFQSKEISLVTEKPSDEEFARLRQEIEKRIGG